MSSFCCIKISLFPIFFPSTLPFDEDLLCLSATIVASINICFCFSSIFNMIWWKRKQVSFVALACPFQCGLLLKPLPKQLCFREKIPELWDMNLGENKSVDDQITQKKQMITMSLCSLQQEALDVCLDFHEFKNVQAQSKEMIHSKQVVN